MSEEADVRGGWEDKEMKEMRSGASGIAAAPTGTEEEYHCGSCAGWQHVI